MNKFKHFFQNILTSGTYNQYEIGLRSRIIFLNAVMLVGIPFLYYFSLSAFSSGISSLGLSTLISGTVVVAVFFIVRIFKTFIVGNYFISLLMLGLYGYLFYSGGEGNSGYLWIYSYPLIAIFLLRITAGSIFALVMMGWSIIVMIFPELSPYEFGVDYAQRIIGVYILIFLFAITYEVVRSTTHRRMVEINKSLQETTAQLSSAKSRTDTIMENVEQGIFLLDRKLCFASEHSRYLSRIFSKSDFGGIHIMDVLGPFLTQKDALATRDYLKLFFKGDINKNLLKDINPINEVKITLLKMEGKRQNAWLRFYFEGIMSPEGDPMIIGLVNDISEEMELQKLLSEEKNTRTRNIETLFSILHTEHSMLSEFLDDCEEDLAEIRKILQDRDKPVRSLLTELYQRIHSMKGNALLLELNRFAESAHGLEEKLRALMESHQARMEDILDLIYDTSTLENEINDIKNMILKLEEFHSSAALDKQQASGLLLKTVTQTVKKQAELEEKAILLDTNAFDAALVPAKHRKILKDGLVQLIRNAVSHGIESPDERTAAGKPENGNITISSQVEDNQLQVQISDDGQGLIASRILEAAKNVPGLKKRDLSSLSEGQIMGLIFYPGFSTRTAPDLTAGRGIGMNLIKSRIEGAGGKLKVKTAPGKYTRFTIVLPL